MELMKQFAAQNRDSIWAFLRRFSEQKDVFVHECTFLQDSFQQQSFYLYYTDDEVVILMKDTTVPVQEEIMDEEYFNGEPPSWFTENARRVSPLYHLLQVMKLAHTACEDAKVNVPKIQGILLTSSRLLNYDDMEEFIATRKVSVISALQLQEMLEKLDDIDVPEPSEEKELDGKKLLQMMTDYFERNGRKLTKVSSTWVPKSSQEMMMESLKKREPSLFDNPDFLDTDEEEHVFFDDEDDNYDLEHDNPHLTDDGCCDDTDSFLKKFEEHWDDVCLELDKKYPEGLGMCVVPMRVELCKPLLSPEEEFNKLVGCEDIRQQIEQLTTLSQYNRRRSRLMPQALQHQVILHAIFTGHPGVGKSTVCKLYGALLHQAGVLSWGHVVVCDRSTFIGNHWGDEEKTVRAVMELASGGVLMVDEAYQLIGSQQTNDPGRLVMPLMMNKLADPKWTDLAVVLCGYPKPMETLLAQNDGLASRFPNRFHFPDFSVEKLEQITLKRVSEYGYTFNREAWAKYAWYLREAYDNRTAQWSNARFVANWLDKIYLHHAVRCEREDINTEQQLLTLTSEDICLPELTFMQ